MKKSVSLYNQGIHDRKALLEAAQKAIEGNQSGAKLEYLSLAEPFSLQEVDKIDPKVGAILSGAVRMRGGTRIIDNVLLGMKQSML